MRPALSGRRSWVVLVALAALTAVVVVLVAFRAGTDRLPAREPAAWGPGTRLAVIGDSFSAGTVQGGGAARNWTALVGSPRGWAIGNESVGGSGYTVAPTDDGRFGAGQLRATIAYRPDVVVVEGSRNDASTPPEKVRGATDAVLRVLRTELPRARVLVVGPIWSSAGPPAPVTACRDAIRAAAAAASVTFADPLAEGWFADPAGLIGADGVHPTDRGHEVMADRIRAHLDRLTEARNG
ncbi:lysophospholipase L1-like esterase [Pseudonocardia sediminis]|uniref:Lysophospholipase L1-like esterase n=1 Tax=Pseudonocardia sediminis TaxID=1397368 RepID=A0A4Q7V323_PSEST|nr:SGNH/GDSL hydrolase family protein [Pseudonocardia sediminis]RZT87894.1 lysophospholipase L1-like esterase [Pseudonocardia sediminis]